MIQKFDQLFYTYTLESLVTSKLDEMYNKFPQPLGELDRVAKADEVFCTDVDQGVCRPTVTIPYGPSLEEVCDRFAFLTLENYVDQPPVVFGVSELDSVVWVPRNEVTKAKFQTDEEKACPVPEVFAVLVYRRAPFIRKRRQTFGLDFQIGQVA